MTTTTKYALLLDKITTARALLEHAVTDLDDADLRQVLRDLHLAAETLDSATRTAVNTARRAGASWADIGHELDLTRQGAQQRYGGPGA